MGKFFLIFKLREFSSQNDKEYISTFFNLCLVTRLEISLETGEAVEYSTRSISSGWFHNSYFNVLS